MLKLVYENDYIELFRYFLDGDECIEDEESGTPIISFNPQAGHTAIDDFDKCQSILESAATSGRPVYSVRYKSVSSENKDLRYIDVLQKLKLAIDTIKQPTRQVSILGLCQGGPVALYYALVYRHEVEEISLFAAPLDSSPSGSILATALKFPYFMYQLLVAVLGGQMDGDWMVKQWRATNEKDHAKKEKIPANKRFYDWFNKSNGKLPSWEGWYGEAVVNMVENNIYNDNIVLGKRRYPLSGLVCKVNLIEGVPGVREDGKIHKGDDICPEGWTSNLAEKLPARCDVQIFKIPAVGHLGAFISKLSQPIVRRICNAAVR